MSFPAEKWAWAVIEVRPRMSDKARLLLVRLAFHANKAGECWPGIASLAASTHADESTVRRHLKRFAKDGLIARVAQQQRSGRGRERDLIQLQLQRPPGQFAPKKSNDQPGKSAAATGQIDPQQPGKSTPSSSIRELKENEKRTDNGHGAGDNRDHRRKLPSVDGHLVTEVEFSTAVAILDRFNERNGSKLGLLGTTGKATDALTRIVMRLRDHPELALADYLSIIDRNFDAPWWKEPKLGGVGPIFGPGAWPRAMACDGIARSGRAVRRNVDRANGRKAEEAPW